MAIGILFMIDFSLSKLLFVTSIHEEIDDGEKENR